MAAISSRFLHYASPLLRALNHSNHGQFPKSSLLSKSPSSPLSFLPQHPPFSLFPSMATSEAGLPGGEWRPDHIHNPLSKKTHSNEVSLLRDTSLNDSAAVAVAADFPLSTCTFPIRRMWRDLPAEEGLRPTPHTSVEATPSVVAAKDFTDGWDSSDNMEAFCEWEKAVAVISAAPSFPTVNEATGRKKVEDNVKILSLEILSFIASSDDDLEYSAVRKITGNAPAAALFPLKAPSQMPSPTLDARRKLERWKMSDFFLKREQRRRREVAERHRLSLDSSRDKDRDRACIREVEKCIREILEEMKKWDGPNRSQAGRVDDKDDDDDNNDNDNGGGGDNNDDKNNK